MIDDYTLINELPVMQTSNYCTRIQILKSNNSQRFFLFFSFSKIYSSFELCSIAGILILSVESMRLSITSTTGCDYIRLHFRSTDEFFNHPYVGIGLFKHQTLTDKDSRNWVFDPTCQLFDPLTSEMLLEGQINMVKALTLCSHILDGMVIIALSVTGIVLVVKGNVRTSNTTACIFSIFIGIAFAISLSFQVLALEKVYESDICSRDEYFPKGWSDRFPLDLYPDYAYFENFSECKLGPDGVTAKEAVYFTGGAFATALLVTTTLLMN